MGDSITRVTIRGFKSIRELENFELGRLNVLVGANGAGKSNFISFFRLLQALFKGSLTDFSIQSGGISNLLFNGRKTTPKMEFVLRFGSHGYRFAMKSIPGEEGFVFTNEAYLDEPGDTGWNELGTRADGKSQLSKFASIDTQGAASLTLDRLRSLRVYHFHDTSANAPMRQAEIIQDTAYLRPDAANIAPFLLHLRENSAAAYSEILDACRIVTPFLDDFLLVPQSYGPAQKVSLSWRAKGSDYPMQPYHLSDGSIRFICLATALLQPIPPSTLIIDEPELGLHPEAIRILGELIQNASLRTQLIIGTQSPLLLDQFDIEDIIVVSRKDGQSCFERLAHSDFNVWLENYSVGELWTKNVIPGGTGP